MKLSDVKDKIDAYFERVSPEEIISQFEAIGYIFDEITPEYNIKIGGFKIETTNRNQLKGLDIQRLTSDVKLNTFTTSAYTKVFIKGISESYSSLSTKGNYKHAMAA